jgi:hypothetical protein
LQVSGEEDVEIDLDLIRESGKALGVVAGINATPVCLLLRGLYDAFANKSIAG